MNEQEFDRAKVAALKTIASGVSVRPPAWEATPPTVGPHGGVSLGPSHLPGVGPVMNIALHSPDGATIVCTMGAQAFAQFGALFNESARRIMSGEFDALTVVQ